MRVALVRCPSYTPEAVQQALQESLTLLSGQSGLEAFIQPGDRVLIKPNFLLAARAEEGITTHPQLIRSMVELLKAYGAHPIIGEDPVFGSVKGVMNALGLMDLVERQAVELVTFNRPKTINNAEGHSYGQLVLDRAVFEADKIINLPKLKAHRQLFLTAAVKNLFGCVSGKRKAKWHFQCGGDDLLFGTMLVETYLHIRPTLTFVDAVDAMEGTGPRGGTMRRLGYLVAGTHCLAIDRVIAELLAVNPLQQWITLAAAQKMGLDEVDWEQIECVGEPLESLRINDFRFPVLEGTQFTLPRVLNSIIRNLWVTQAEKLDRLRPAQKDAGKVPEGV